MDFCWPHGINFIGGRGQLGNVLDRFYIYQRRRFVPLNWRWSTLRCLPNKWEILPNSLIVAVSPCPNKSPTTTKLCDCAHESHVKNKRFKYSKVRTYRLKPFSFALVCVSVCVCERENERAYYSTVRQSGSCVGLMMGFGRSHVSHSSVDALFFVIPSRKGM